MEIKGTQTVKVEVSNYDMRGIVDEWLRKQFNIGVRDFVTIPMTPREKAEDFVPLMVRQEDNSTHNSSTRIVGNPQPATDIEVAVWKVLGEIHKF